VPHFLVRGYQFRTHQLRGPSLGRQKYPNKGKSPASVNRPKKGLKATDGTRSPVVDDPTLLNRCSFHAADIYHCKAVRRTDFAQHAMNVVTHGVFC